MTAFAFFVFKSRRVRSSKCFGVKPHAQKKCVWSRLKIGSRMLFSSFMLVILLQ